MKHELRIGNTVKCESYIATVDQLKSESLVLRDTDGVEVYATYEDISGIPLTSDILERLETYKINEVNKEYGFQKQPYSISFAGEMLGWRLYNHVSRAYIGDLIKTFHQLQNLFFALTGQELTLKPETI